ncbi:MAG: methylated-DNA--[protein]-cysteine S-methyltransferase [Bacillota bacterium]
MKSVLFVKTPLGVMTLMEADGALKELRFAQRAEPGEQQKATPLLRKAETELKEYFAGRRKAFTVPMAPEGTAFQQSVWNALLEIPYGETLSYGEVARRIGNPKAARAVGMANHQNPLPVFCPCHRVIGANGKLVGYGGGLPVKEYLLALETKAAR